MKNYPLKSKIIMIIIINATLSSLRYQDLKKKMKMETEKVINYQNIPDRQLFRGPRGLSRNPCMALDLGV